MANVQLLKCTRGDPSAELDPKTGKYGSRVEEVLHTGLVELWLSYGNKFGMSRMSRGKTRQIVVTQLISLRRLKALTVFGPEAYCQPLKFVYRSALEMSLVKLHLDFIDRVTAITLKFVKAVSRSEVLKDIFLSCATGKSQRLAPSQFYNLVCSHNVIPNLAIDISCCLTMQAGALHRLLKRTHASGGILDTLRLKGVGNKPEKFSETCWRSIFGEIARGRVHSFHPSSLGLQHSLVSGPIEALDYFREPSVLDSIVLLLNKIARYRQQTPGSAWTRLFEYVVLG